MTRVLLADDDPHVRFTIRAAIEYLGHTVQEAHDGDACLELLTTGCFDLLLMDAQMPGAPLTTRLEHGRTHRDPPPRIVIITGMVISEIAHLLGPTEQLIRKPITLATLQQILAEQDTNDGT